MLLTFSRFVNEVAEPASKGDRDFKKNHVFVKNTRLADKSTDDDNLFNASNVSKTKRHADRESNDHDKKEYEKFNGGVSESVVEEDDGWYAHREIHGSKGISKEDWKKGWRLNSKGKRVQMRKEELEYIDEAGMPASVIKHKQQLANLSDEEFAEKHGNKTEKELRDLAARHGYGWNKTTKTGSDHYVKRVAKGKRVEANEEVVDPNTMATDATEFSDPKPEIADAAAKMPQEELKKVLKTEEKKFVSMSSTIRNVLGK